MPRHYVKRECSFCKKKAAADYKDVATLQRYLTSWSKIKKTRDTGTCARHQRALAQAIKRARFLALLTYASR